MKSVCNGLDDLKGFFQKYRVIIDTDAGSSGLAVMERLRKLKQSGEKVVKKATFDFFSELSDIRLSISGTIQHLNFIMEYAAGFGARFSLVLQESRLTGNSEAIRDIQEDVGRVGEVISSVKGDIDDIKEDTAAIKGDTSEIKENTRIISTEIKKLNELKPRILEWLTSVEYSQRLNDVFGEAESGTGRWFLDSDEFRAWLLADRSSILFCHGRPGAGKTFISSITIRYLQDLYQHQGGVAITYLFCDYREKEMTAQSMILSLLRQLLQEHVDLPPAAKVIFEKHKDRKTRPRLEDFLDCLSAVINDRGFFAVYIVIDALDEFQSQDGSSRVKFMEMLFSVQQKASTIVKILVTSRALPDIEEIFEQCPSLEIRAKEDDVQLYLERNAERVTKDKVLQKAVTTAIADVVDGMYVFL